MVFQTSNGDSLCVRSAADGSTLQLPSTKALTTMFNAGTTPSLRQEQVHIISLRRNTVYQVITLLCIL